MADDEQVTETTVRQAGRVTEAKGTAADGGRVFGVEIVQPGTSRNGVHYPEAVLSAAAPLYDGAKAFDHHRTTEEVQTSTMRGLVGHYENVGVAAHGAIEADLHLLPSAVHVAEALDQTLAAQSRGLPPIVGISHDVRGTFTPTKDSTGRTVREATAITAVASADVVADPSAGGRITRMVAGGISDDTTTQEGDPMTRLQELAAKLVDGTITDQERTEFGTLLATDGADDNSVDTSNVPDTPAGAVDDAADDPVADDADAPTEELVGAATEATVSRDDLTARLWVREATDGLPQPLADYVKANLPERVTEADIINRVAMVRSMATGLEKAGLTRVTEGQIHVGVEEHDRLVRRLDATLGDPAAVQEGAKRFTSFQEMYAEFTPDLDRRDLLSTGLPRMILREAYQGIGREGDRVTEAVTASTFGEALGDSITRAMIRDYSLPQLSNWRQVVSQISTVSDFRTQRRDRIGGYGTLPAVAEGASYTALTTPGDEEATYAVAKKGGTESLTFEAVKNDDMNALARIPRALGRAGAQTLYRFVWDMFTANAATTYDATTWFHANHSNTGTAALAAAGLVTTRAAMREQTAYGDSSEVLGIGPSLLVVPAELEQTAFELCNSAVAVTSNKDATVPNINVTLDYIVVPYWTDADNWYAVADPSLVPTIEVGFLDGQEDPELFVQDMGSVGSMFDADKVTYKIRHIYSGAALDHRGVYRNVVT